MTQHLLTYVSGDISKETIAALRSAVARLQQCSWTFEPPTFVHEVDAESATRPEDDPILTIGVMLRVPSPHERPETSAAEARQLIDAVAVFSRSYGVDFEVELDDVYVGEIRSGDVDGLLRQGLLERW